MTASLGLSSGELTWTLPDEGHPAFVLRAGSEDIGWLQFEEKPGARSSAALGSGRWTLERTGAVHPTVTVRAEGDETVVMEFAPCLTGGGMARFANGRVYCWIREHLWSNKWCFRCKLHKAVCVSQDTLPLTAASRVAVCVDATHLPETPVLVLLAWYLRLLEAARVEDSIFVCG